VTTIAFDTIVHHEALFPQATHWTEVVLKAYPAQVPTHGQVGPTVAHGIQILATGRLGVTLVMIAGFG